ncbi:unnamed protein product [Parnassius mnemosyne]|uniref:Uncharacterized protein n=1 Tax=Parnassius mnemosyne TaxID=213953 RepID=A0AAV1KLC6_9NEOP
MSPISYKKNTHARTHHARTHALTHALTHARTHACTHTHTCHLVLKRGYLKSFPGVLKMCNFKHFHVFF